MAISAPMCKVEEPGATARAAAGRFREASPIPTRAVSSLPEHDQAGVTLDCAEGPRKPALHSLVEHADVLIHNFRPARWRSGHRLRALRDVNPRLVVLLDHTVRLGGPYSDYAAEEITLAHGGGWAWLSPVPRSESICRR